MTWVFVGAATMALALGVSGCGDLSSNTHPGQSYASTFGDTTPEKATARGLIAAILAHLNADDVKSVGAAQPDEQYTPPPGMERGPGYVSVDLKDGTSIGLSVSDFIRGPSPFSCDVDSGYRPILCRDKPYKYIGVVDPNNDLSAQMPDFEGRTRAPQRGEVLVQVWSKQPQRELVDLIHALLDDGNVGMRTTADLNARGAALKDVDVIRIETTTEVIQ